MSKKNQPVIDNHLHENVSHGSSLFSFACYPGYRDSESLLVTYHWHKEVEILCFEKGTATVLLSGKEYNAKAGDIIFVNQGELHQISSDAPELFYYAFDFLLDSLCFQGLDYAQNQYLTPLAEKELFFPHIVSSTAPDSETIFNELMDVVKVYKAQAVGYQMRIKSSLLKIISILIENQQLSTASEAGIRIYSERERQLKEILTYIQNHYAQKMYLEDIADAFHMSSKYFSRYFKKHFGYSFVEYVNHVRIEKACLLLATTAKSIMEISMDTGFENLSYFIRKFKELTGYTPSDYRTLYTHTK